MLVDINAIPLTENSEAYKTYVASKHDAMTKTDKTLKRLM